MIPYCFGLDKSMLLEFWSPVSLKDHILFQAIIQHQAMLMPVFRDMAHARLGTIPNGSMGDILTAEGNGSACDILKASQSLDKLTLSITINTGDTDDLATAYIERNVLYRIIGMGLTRNRHMLNFQNSLTWCGRFLIYGKADIASYHHTG